MDSFFSMFQGHTIMISSLEVFMFTWMVRIERIIMAVRLDAMQRKTLLETVHDDIKDIKSRQQNAYTTSGVGNSALLNNASRN
jgi:hypothetical protein